MRSRERLAETISSINPKVFAEQCLTPPLYPLIGWGEYFEDLIAEAKAYLGMPF